MKKENNKNIFIKIIVILAFTILGLLVFNMVSINVILLFFSLLIIFFLDKKYWFLLIASIPFLILGQFFNIEINPNWIYEISIPEILILLITFALVLRQIIVDTKVKININKIGLGLLVYLLVGLSSYFYAPDLSLYVAGMKILIMSFLAYELAFNLINDKKRIKYYLISLYILALLLSAQILYKFYDLGFSKDLFLYRSTITIPMGAIALVSATLAFLLPVLVAVYFSLDNKSKVKPFAFSVIALGFLAVFLSLGKAAILSLFLGLAYLFFKLKKKQVGLVLAFAFLVLLGYTFFSSFFVGLIDRIKNAFIDSNTKFRVLEYRVSWKIFKEHPWFGVGIGQQIDYFSKMLYPDYKQWANNFFLQVMIDLGVVGLSLLLTIIYFIIKQVKRLHKMVNSDNALIFYGFVSSLIVAFVNGLFEVTIFALPYAIIFWINLGVMSNIQKYER